MKQRRPKLPLIEHDPDAGQLDLFRDINIKRIRRMRAQLAWKLYAQTVSVDCGISE